jgi:DNA (cytosine-5)-methyltransferase 1
MGIASFFSGIGGLELGLEMAGLGPVVFQCESDAYATQVLEKHWPDVPRHGDITTLDHPEIPRATFWCGGFPCTDISYAGKGAGIHDGQQSSLWWDWFRLIRLARPPVLIVENVPAITSRGLGDILMSLAGVGYDAEWHTVSAAQVGAPHLRQRIFIIAHLADANLQRLEGRDSKGLLRSPSERPPRALRPHHTLPRGRSQWLSEPHVRRVAAGLRSRMDRLRCLGNAVVPQCAYTIGLRAKEIVTR